MTGQHVRITLEGVADGVPDGQVLRVRMGGNAGPLVLISKAWPGVAVEDVTPKRVWTDGDVVQHTITNEAWGRGTELWDASADDDVDEAVASGEYRILRYQAGE